MRNLSMDALCEKIGNAVSKQAISKYEKGESLPGSQILILLSQALDVKPDYFFRESQFAISNIEFRKKAKMGVKEVDAIKEEIRDNIERYLEIEDIWGCVPSFANPVKEMLVASEDDVYNLTKAIFDNIDAIAKENGKGAELSIDNATSGMTAPFHAGAAKYFAEKGVNVETK